MNRVSTGFAIGLILSLLVGCSDDATEPSPPEESLNVAITAESTSFSTGDAVTITVAAENPTESEIVFGNGSTLCQLIGVVQSEPQDLEMLAYRACSQDVTWHSLDPGEQRVESWTWHGEYLVEGGRESLVPGIYEIKGVAGSFVSAPLTIEIVN